MTMTDAFAGVASVQVADCPAASMVAHYLLPLCFPRFFGAHHGMSRSFPVVARLSVGVRQRAPIPPAVNLSSSASIVTARWTSSTPWRSVPRPSRPVVDLHGPSDLRLRATRQAPQDPQRAHPLRAHLQMLDRGPEPLQRLSNPPLSGTEHLAAAIPTIDPASLVTGRFDPDTEGKSFT
jgi:hypothetical protein